MYIVSSVTLIDCSAFSLCDNLKSITIPEGVSCIGADAFRDCNCLESVTIPSSVMDMGSDAFLTKSKLIIKCEAKTKPAGWDKKWKGRRAEVVWDAFSVEGERKEQQKEEKRERSLKRFSTSINILKHIVGVLFGLFCWLLFFGATFVQEWSLFLRFLVSILIAVAGGLIGRFVFSKVSWAIYRARDKRRK